ncbi:cytochrome C oxidase subunit IV family protein (plasmid) [Rhodococcus sp. ZPP]|uniref:cytochrome C oxidase subunit IV family protein n=1 Tax=Rhodococcus sp. ZPP TaxID=2749906 RepID=UPI001AD86FC2|nr:cytochrome C oxidase subunit IV family protein [Rhodococcus sp. ZPP]QTJ70726.1 cytochrome C oxidase subunit IV family protein [Rhodococcus sp. ZPP]
MMKEQQMGTVKFSVKDPLVIVWAVLIALTFASLWMGAGHNVGGMSGRLATVLVLLMAFAKAGAVARYFMEVRESVLPLRIVVAAWFGLAASATVGLYLWT